jgi:FlaA1/EpsC-like NDP-sugar epimerase
LDLREKFPGAPLYSSISTINDLNGLRVLIKDMQVDMVFHAAAYKHVPLMEVAPVESAYNNILGTHNLAQAALEAGVQKFVMVSTDKAVNPTNVMGMSKRIAEMVVQSYNGYGQTKFMTVRFGNVLGSAGSVTPLFKRQISQRGPVTVTHPQIERFFMTISEAVQLVLQAGSMGNGGEIFVLEMGKPVKILHLAEKLITLSGKRPYDDIDIEFTGLRPGEKMYEELFRRDEKQIATDHSQIRVALSQAPDKSFMRDQIEEIRRIIQNRDETALRSKFKELVPEYRMTDNFAYCLPNPASPVKD